MISKFFVQKHFSFLENSSIKKQCKHHFYSKTKHPQTKTLPTLRTKITNYIRPTINSHAPINPIQAWINKHAVKLKKRFIRREKNFHVPKQNPVNQKEKKKRRHELIELIGFLQYRIEQKRNVCALIRERCLIRSNKSAAFIRVRRKCS